MAERRNVPWTTVAVEAIAIVVSILLAFAIDAWWTERNERENEQSALLALRSDLEASREQLAVVLRSLSIITFWPSYSNVFGAPYPKGETIHLRRRGPASWPGVFRSPA